MAESLGTSNLLIDNSSTQGQVVGILMYITPKVAQTLGGMCAAAVQHGGGWGWVCSVKIDFSSCIGGSWIWGALGGIR